MQERGQCLKTRLNLYPHFIPTLTSTWKLNQCTPFSNINILFQYILFSQRPCHHLRTPATPSRPKQVTRPRYWHGLGKASHQQAQTKQNTKPSPPNPLKRPRCFSHGMPWEKQAPAFTGEHEFTEESERKDKLHSSALLSYVIKLQYHILQRTTAALTENRRKIKGKTNCLACLQLNEAEKSWASAVGEASREKRTIAHNSDLCLYLNEFPKHKQSLPSSPNRTLWST